MKPHNTQQTQRLMLAVAFSLVILLGFEVLWMGQRQPLTLPETPPTEASAPIVVEEAPPTLAEVETTPATPPVVLGNTSVRMVYHPQGGKVVEWTLENYTRNGGDELGYPHLNQQAATHAEYAESGWLAAGIAVPDATTPWQVTSREHTTATLQWENTTGQTFTRTLTLNDNYTLAITDTVRNTASLPVSITPYAQIHRSHGEFTGEMSTWVSYHGPMGVVVEDGAPLLHKHSYGKLQDGKPFTPLTAHGGWWGISSHYFISAWVPNGWGASTRTFRATNTQKGQTPIFTAALQGEPRVVPTGGETTLQTTLYAGPKQEQALLAAGNHLERSIDWGWFRMLARPFYQAMLWFYQHTGSWALAIVLITLLLKLATFPLANKSYVAMAKMKKLQPDMEKLKELHGQDQQAMAMAMMKLYRDNKVNPLSGCWPMLIQIPIFFAMYKVVLLAFEFRHAAPGLWPLDYWMTDLSLMDPWFILPVLMGLSMWFQMRLNPPPADPAQAMVFQWMPVIFTVMFLWFPAALVWYWLVNNVLGIAQQWWIMRREKAI